MARNSKAVDFYDIQDAVAFNIPVDSDNPFYVNFTPYRADFTEKKVFKHLGINPRTTACRHQNSSVRMFLSGYRGTGKTSELLNLTKKIDETKCYFTVFIDISDEDTDTANIETVDVLILMLKKVIELLKERGADVSNETISDFYNWYKSSIVEEINKSVEGSAKVEVGVDMKNTLFNFIGLVGNTQVKLQGSNESKTVIRREINNNFKMFGTRFNEFINALVRQFRDKKHYQDILFIVDGFERIGSLEDRRKILIDDANKFTIIDAHMIITLPIELLNEKNCINNFATIENFPLIDLKKEGATECFRSFILKRVDIKLFDSDATIDKIIEFGAGHPRQTLQIIKRAYIEAEEEILDLASVEKSIEILAAEMSQVDDEEIALLKKVNAKEIIAENNDIYRRLKSKNIIFEYNNNSEDNIINPIVLADMDFQKLLKK